MSTPTQNPVSPRENLVVPRALTRLKPERVQEGLKKLPNWRTSRDGKSLRTFKFATDRAPLAFAELVLALTAKEGQQPSLTLSTNGTVECKLTTKVAGGITRRDLEMARRISNLG